MSIGIWGLGTTAQSVYRFLKKERPYLIYPKESSLPQWAQEVAVIYQEDLPKAKDRLHQIIISPGIDPRQAIFKELADIEIISEVELAFRCSDIPIIAITGTNGKTSTATMMAKALELWGKRVFLGGNIGTPYIEIVGKQFDFAVIEVSSFQLEAIKDFHPQVAMILNITENHMERYDSFDAYKNAKANIVKNLTANDLFIVDKSLGIQSQAKTYFIKALDDERLLFHQRKNLDCVKETLSFLGHPSPHDIIEQIINKFEPVKFRMQKIKSVGEVDIYNDAKSTNIAATLAALQSFDKPVTLILGGKLRDDKPFQFIEDLKTKKISQILLLGESSKKLNNYLGGDFQCTFVEKETLLDEIKKVKDGVILFSPAFPSFDYFSNYQERGQWFTDLVAHLRD